ncbi:MAG: ABC transporter ATP-binding protein, partial [Acidobacteriota bacterium]|nr:ABC transporter ATP-binding protein [Acidobacteriota bacterium]
FTTATARVEALSDFDLSLKRGEFVSLVGPSGCGKSTLLRVVAGLHRDYTGHVTLDPEIRRRSLGFVFQRDSLLPWRTVLANVESGLELRKVDKRERTERARAWIDRVGLGGFESAYPSQLSGGMRQRASIARSLIYEPELILMDEPFGALDAQAKGQIQEMFVALWEELRPSVIFVTHDLAESIYLAERVVVVSGRPGRVKAEVPVGLERPRTSPFEIWSDQHYLALHGQVWTHLKSEIEEA